MPSVIAMRKTYVGATVDEGQRRVLQAEQRVDVSSTRSSARSGSYPSDSPVAKIESRSSSFAGAGCSLPVSSPRIMLAHSQPGGLCSWRSTDSKHRSYPLLGRQLWRQLQHLERQEKQHRPPKLLHQPR